MFKRNKPLTIFLILVTVVIIITGIGTTSSGSKVIRSIFTTPVSYIETGVDNVVDFFGKFFTSISKSYELTEENEKLKVRISELESRLNQYEELREENIVLKKALDLKDTYDRYEVVSSNVVAIESGNWFDYFSIDSGSNKGIYEDLPVVSYDNYLIGRSIAQGFNTCYVVGIIDEESGISGWVESNNAGNVSIKGDYKLKQQGLCLVENIPYEIEIEVGDVVKTSGLGGIYPKGIPIGTIEKVFNTDNPFNRYAYLKPYVDFKNIDTVYVLVPKIYEEEGE